MSNVDTSPLGIERTERIAGDEALNSRLDNVTAELQGTQESVTTEVLHRSEGDLVIQRILEGYIQDLLTGKTEELERYIAFQTNQNLNYEDVRDFVGNIRASLAEEIRTLTDILMTNLQDNDVRYNKLVSDVGRYLDILSDITLDSNQITLDDGELRAGAWTILSQARQWDLDIINRLNGLSASVGDSLKDAVEEIQNQLPSTEDTISKAIEELSKSPQIKELSDALSSAIEDVTALDVALIREHAERQRALSELAAQQADALANEKALLLERLVAESQDRVDALQREATIRQQMLLDEAAVRQQALLDEAAERTAEVNAEVDARKAAIDELAEEMLTRADLDKAEFQSSMATVTNRIKSAEDGLTSEIQHRKDGDASNLNALNTYKVSNDSAITGLTTSLSNNVTKTNANTTLINGLTARMTTAESGIESATTAAADAMTKATTAVTANTALATRVDALAASITESEGTSVDVNAFNALKAEVTSVQGVVTGLTEDVTTLESNYTSVNNKVNAHGTSISTLNNKMTAAENSISQSANDITLLKTDITDINSSLLTKVDSQAFSQLSSDVSELEGNYTTQAGLVTDLRGSLDTTIIHVNNAATAAQDAMNAAGSKGKVIFGSTAPAVSDRLSQNLWIDTKGNANTPKRWNGSAWVVVTDKVATDALAAANAATTLAHTKVDTSAFNSLDQQVTVIDGQVSANTNSITSLSGKISTVEGSLVTKLDSSAISNYYTKGQTDAKAAEISAGKVEEFKATLGGSGVNLFGYDMSTLAASSGTWSGSGYSISRVLNGGLTPQETAYKLKAGGASGNYVTSGRGDWKSAIEPVIGNKYILSMYVKSPIAKTVRLRPMGITEANGTGALLPAQNFDLVPDVWTRISILHEVTSISFPYLGWWLYHNYDGGAASDDNYVLVTRPMLERTYGTTASPSNWVEGGGVSSQVSANSNAIQDVYAEVERVDGDVTAVNNATTALSGRVSTVEGQVATKAEAAALTALTTRVTNTENTNTSQGTAITTLQNTINHSTTGLATKASTSALNVTKSDVTRIDGTVSGHTNQLTQLTSDISTINGTLATKANASALNDIYTKNQTDSKALEIAAGEVNKYNASLSIGLDNLLPTQFDLWEDGYWNTSNGVATSGSAYSRTKADVKIPVVAGEKYSLRSNTRTVLVFYSAANARTGHHESGTGTPPTTAQVITVPANSAYVRAYLFGASGAVVKPNPFDQEALTELQGMLVRGEHTKLIWQPSALGSSSQIDANASAIELTNSEVARVDGRVTTTNSNVTALTGRVGTVEGALTTKAGVDALNSLTTRVEEVEGGMDTQASEITTLSSKIDSRGGGHSLIPDYLMENVNEWRSNYGYDLTPYFVKVTDGKIASTVFRKPANVSSCWNYSRTAVPNDRAYKLSMWVRRAVGSAGSIYFICNRIGTDGVHDSVNAYVAKSVPTTNEWTYLEHIWDQRSLKDTVPQIAFGFALNHSSAGAIAEMQGFKVEAVLSTSDTDSSVATADAVQAVDTRVTAVDGRVTTNANSIIGLTSRLGTAEGLLTKKADASALNNHYTKAEADDEATLIAAGEINKYDASLVIGGSNLLKESNKFLAGGGGSGLTREVLADGSLKLTGAGVTFHTFTTSATMNSSTAMLKVGDKFTVTFWIKAVDVANLPTVMPSLYLAGPHPSYLNDFKVIGDLSKGGVVRYVQTRTCSRASTTLGNTHMHWGSGTVGGGLIIEKWQIEIGTKSTDWTPNSEEIQSQLDANASALDTLNSDVSLVDGRVTTEANRITALTGRVSTVEGSKADVSALNALTTRVGDVEGGLATQVTSTTNLTASLAATDKIAKDALPQISSFSSYKIFRNVLNYYYSTSSSSLALVIQTPITFTSKMFKVTITGYNYTTDKSNINLEVSGYAYSGTSILQHGAINHGTFPVTVKLGVRDSKLVIILLRKVQNWAYPQFNVDAEVGYTAAPDTWKDGWSVTPMAEGAFATNGITAIITPTTKDMPAELDANVGALSTLTAEVTSIDGVVKGHTTDISNLTTSIAGKADASALSSLTARVEAEENKSTTQAQSIVSLNGSVADALKAVTISDTRSTNQPPSWYWSNYPRRTVNEFKTQTAIGVGGFFGGTYCNLETKVYYSDSSGGHLIQTATSAADPSLYVQRVSTSTSAWGTWKQPIKDLRDDLAGKASASAVSTLSIKVNDIDGLVTSQADQITTLTSDNNDNKNKLTVQGKVIDGVKANYMVKMETNGVLAGFGLIQESGAMGTVTSTFGVNANNFYVGAPSGGKKPFIITTANQVVNGVTYPAGTYIDVAMIGNATIGTAKIADLAVTTAKIGNGQITTAKIGDLQVDTLKIKDWAVTKPFIYESTDTTFTGSYTITHSNLVQRMIVTASGFTPGALVMVSVNSDLSITNREAGTNTGVYISGIPTITLNLNGVSSRISHPSQEYGYVPVNGLHVNNRSASIPGTIMYTTYANANGQVIARLYTKDGAGNDKAGTVGWVTHSKTIWMMQEFKK